MDTPVRLLLKAVRRARGGFLDLDGFPSAVHGMLRGNLAGTCRTLALWADSEIRDPRAADAFLRTYGLGRMPETRAAIGRSLRSADGRRGTSPAAVDVLVRRAEAQLARRLDGLTFPGPWGSPTPGSWVDPFPEAARRGEVRRQLQQVLWSAWADIPDEPLHECRSALLLYEQEHGVRRPLVEVRHREKRRRLRRLAWSMLTVARERQVGKQPDDVLVDLLLGPRRLALVERLPEEAARFLGATGSSSAEGIEQALAYVRDAVRHGRAEAPELLGLLREAIARGGQPTMPASVTAGVMTLSTIVAREHASAAGVLSASQGILLATEAGERLSQQPHRHSRQRHQQARTLSDGLRAAQEVAELHDVLGNTSGARRALGHMAGLVRYLEPADTGEVQSWRQQHLQTRSTIARHAAPSSRHGDWWLRQADRDARRSLELAESESLPLAYRLVPLSQLLATAISTMRPSGAADAQARRRQEHRARRYLADALVASQAVEGPLDRPTHSARLSVARRWWELALLCGDPDEIVAARSAAHDLVRPCTLHHDLQKLGRLESMSRAQGVAGTFVPSPAMAMTQ